MLLWMLLIVYLAIAVTMAFVLADTNHNYTPTASQWLLGLMWLPAILVLVISHYHYKFMQKKHQAK